MRILSLPFWFLVLTLLSCQTEKKHTGSGQTSKSVIFSPVFTADKLYKSMLGPFKTAELTPVSKEPELVWITGFESVVVNESGDRPLSQEFMCHSNLRYNFASLLLIDTGPIFKSTRHQHSRIFTISQGQTAVQFPTGFGIPVMGNEGLLLDNQLLNVNANPEERKKPVSLRYKNVIEYIKEKDTNREMIPLYQVEAGVMVSLDTTDSYFDTLLPNEIQSGAMCAPGITATSEWGVTRQDAQGQNFSYHWILGPGKEVRHTLITSQVNLQFDTTIHYIAVHMHPYAESLVLKDLTDDKIIFSSTINSYRKRTGLKSVDFLSSAEGIPVYKDHDYDLISTYNNTSGETQDAMALIYIYLRDQDFEVL